MHLAEKVSWRLVWQHVQQGNKMCQFEVWDGYVWLLLLRIGSYCLITHWLLLRIGSYYVLALITHWLLLSVLVLALIYVLVLITYWLLLRRGFWLRASDEQRRRHSL